LRRGGALRGAAVADLTELVTSPAPYAAIDHRATVVVTASHRADPAPARESADLHRGGVSHTLEAAAAITELAI
jgi:hypothetical protein